MSDKLPDLIDPIALAERRAVLSGAIPVAALTRLSDLVAEPEGEVRVEVSFVKEGRLAFIAGRIDAELRLICQACLQAVAWQGDLAFKLAAVSSLEEADRLGLDCEPLLFNGERVSLTDLIEDEILLALPDYPKHDYDCLGQFGVAAATEQAGAAEKAVNPFSVLAHLKFTGDKNGSSKE